MSTLLKAIYIQCIKRYILPNRSDVLPVNMRCTRAAVGQYEVACRGVRTCFKSVGFFLVVFSST